MTESHKEIQAQIVAAQPKNQSGRSLRSELRVLSYINDYLAQKGIAPSYAEMGVAADLTPTGADMVVRRLISKGLVEHGAHMKRDFVLTAAAHTLLAEKIPSYPQDIPAQLPESTRQFLTSQEIHHELHAPPFHNEGKHLSLTPEMQDLLAARDIDTADTSPAPETVERTEFSDTLRAEFFRAITTGQHEEVETYLNTELPVNHADINRLTLEMAFSYAVLSRNGFATGKILSCADEGNLHRDDFDRMADRLDAKAFYAPFAYLAPKMRD